MLRYILCAVSALTLVAPSQALPATPTNNPAKGEPQKSVIEQALDKAFTEMMRPGPAEPNWNKGGVDIEGIIRARPGGAAGNYLLTVDKDGDRNVEIYTAEPVRTYLPANWTLVSQTGAIDAATADVTLGIGSLDKRYFFVLRTRGPRVGDAFCADQLIGAQLYEDPRKSSEMPAEFALAFFNYMASRMNEYSVCTTYQGTGPGYSYRHFFKDGRPLPALSEEGSVASIVSAAPVAELLGAE